VNKEKKKIWDSPWNKNEEEDVKMRDNQEETKA